MSGGRAFCAWASIKAGNVRRCPCGAVPQREGPLLAAVLFLISFLGQRRPAKQSSFRAGFSWVRNL